MLKAGMSIVDISPKKGVQLSGYPHCPRQNEGIHDPAYASCMFLDNGEKKIAIVAMDLLFFTKKYVNELRSKFDFEIAIEVSHSHSTPMISYIHDFERAEGIADSPEFREELLCKLEKLIKDASENTFDAQFSTYIGRCGAERGVGGNRRTPGGPADPTVNVMCVRDMDEKIRGIYLCYALHPTYLHAENVLVSADYPGYIRRYLSFAYPDAIFMFAQGTSGNQSSRYHRVAQNFEEACRVGTTLGTEVHNCIEKMEFTDKLDISVRRTEIDLPRRKFRSSAEAKPAMEEARARCAALKDADYITMRNAELDMFGAEDLYYLALELEEGETFYDKQLPCEIGVIELNDTALLLTQGEIFVEYGLEIKEKSKYDKTFVVELANGELPGYIYTEEALCDGGGGYEVGNSIFSPDAGKEIVKAAVKLLNGED